MRPDKRYQHKMPDWLLKLVKRAHESGRNGNVEGDWRVSIVFDGGMFHHAVYTDPRANMHYIGYQDGRFFELKEV